MTNMPDWCISFTTYWFCLMDNTDGLALCAMVYLGVEKCYSVNTYSHGQIRVDTLIFYYILSIIPSSL